MNSDEYTKMAAVESDHWWFRGRRAILAQIITRLELGPRPVILEAGCGTAGNLKMLFGFGAVCAFDLSADARAVALRGSPKSDICSVHVRDAMPFQNRDVPGYASLMTVSMFLGGLPLLGLVVLEEYVGRLHDEAKQRPIYVASRIYE